MSFLHVCSMSRALVLENTVFHTAACIVVTKCFAQYQADKSVHGMRLESVNQCYDNAPKLSERTVKEAQLSARALRDNGHGRRVLHTKFTVKETPLAAQLQAW